MLFKASLLSLATLAIAGPDKPAMNPGLNRNGLKQGLLENLHPMHSTWEYWGKGWLPQSCRDIAKGHGLNPADFTVFNVHYDDCSAAWTFCRHKDSGADEISMIDIFGRMPVKMRGFIRVFIATPGLHDGAAAFTFSNGDLVFEDRPGIDTMVHEISHSLDWHALPQYKSPFSSDPIWSREYNRDSHTPTGYGRTNFMEDFAETGMVGVYDVNVGGGIGNIASNWNQIYHQYATYSGYLGDLIKPGGACNKRFDNPPTVSAYSKMSAKMLVGEKPDNSIAGHNVTIITPKKEVEGQVAYTWL